MSTGSGSKYFGRETAEERSFCGKVRTINKLGCVSAAWDIVTETIRSLDGSASLLRLRRALVCAWVVGDENCFRYCLIGRMDRCVV